MVKVEPVSPVNPLGENLPKKDTEQQQMVSIYILSHYISDIHILYTHRNHW